MSLLPQFGSLLWSVAAFVVALSVIVAVHEYGHYIVGRWSGIHADVFSLGFGPVIYARIDKRGTKWQLALFPLGGYVKFRGDANAASGKDGDAMSDLSPEELRSTMHGAPLWARAATVAAGPIFNFILSILIFAGIFYSIGVPSTPPTIAKIYPTHIEGITIQAGDKIVGIEGQKISDESMSDLVTELVPSALISYDVLRDGNEIQAFGPLPTTARITSVRQGSAAQTAGLLEGDVIVAANGQDIFRFRELIALVADLNGAPVNLTIWRDGAFIEQTITPTRSDIPMPDNSFETRWLIGVTDGIFYEPQFESQSVFSALKKGVTRTYDIAALSISGMYHMVAQKISSCNMSGPLGIAKASSQMASAGPQAFIGFIALLSTAVGLLNLFPVPVLDGGHLVFYAYEAVVGKPIGDRVLQVLMTIGLVLVLSLMVFALSNDLFCP